MFKHECSLSSVVTFQQERFDEIITILTELGEISAEGRDHLWHLSEHRKRILAVTYRKAEKERGRLDESTST